MVGFTMACVAGVAVRVRGSLWPVCAWSCVAPCAHGRVRMLCVCMCEKKGGGPWRAPLFCGVQAAVSYSPTPWRVQYHRRWQS